MHNLPPFKFKTKAELLGALNAQLEHALAYDAAQAKAHHKAEAAYLKFFRARLREALRLPYPEAKQNGFRVVSGKWSGDEVRFSAIPEMQRPVCPSSRADTVRNAIRLVEGWSWWPERGPLVVRDRGQHQFLHGVLSLGPDRRPDVCA